MSSRLFFYNLNISNGNTITNIGSGNTNANLNITGNTYLTQNVTIGSNLVVTGPTLKIPTGNISSRPVTPENGSIRYNTETSQFEGYGPGGAWGSLGGVVDIAQTTKILASESPSTTDGNLYFFTIGSERMRISSSGNIGIGTTAPGVTLDVNGSSLISGNVTIGSNLVVTGPTLKIPTGNISSRPVTPENGSIRYNTETSQFEGYGPGGAWGSLGGVVDIAQTTRILASETPSTTDGNLYFFTIGSERMRINSAGNIGIGTTAPNYTLDVNGIIRSTTLNSTDITTTNLIATNFTAGNFSANNINFGITSSFSGSFSASNNISTPSDITGFNLINENTRSFQSTVTINIIRSSGGNLYQNFVIDGFRTDSGWSLYRSAVGDVTGIDFSIISNGQIQYTAPNIIDFVSNTIRFSVTQISDTGTYNVNNSLTQGTLLINSLQIQNTQPSILGTNNGSLYVLGGSTLSKNVNILATDNAIGLGTGGGLTVFGGTAISKDLYVGGTITAANLNATTISGSSLSLSNNLNVAGTLTVVNITATNLMDTNLTAGIARITNNLSAIGNSNTLGSLFTTDGNVGINTTNPTYRLDVTGNARINSSDLYIGSGTSASLLHLWDVPGAAWHIATGGFDFNVRNGTIGSTMTSRFTISSNGNVGIATTSPTNSLVVVSSGATVGNLKLVASTNAANDNWWIGFGHGSLSSDSNDRARIGTNIATDGGGRLFFTTGVAGAQTERLRIDESGNIGVNTSNPQRSLDVTGRIMLSNGALDSTDYGALQIVQNDSAINTRAHIALIRTSQQIGYIRVNTSNQLVLSAGGGGVFLTSGGTSWSAVSDKNLKTDFQDISNPLDKVMNIKGIYYKFKTDSLEQTRRVGVIAQDVQSVLPEIVSTDKDGVLGVSYTDLVPLLIEAIKEQQVKINKLETFIQNKYPDEFN